MSFVRTSSVIVAAADGVSPPGSGRKWPITYTSVSAIAVVADVVAIIACGIGTGVLYNIALFDTADVWRYFGAAAVVAAFFVSVMKGQDLYNPSELLSLKTQLRSVTTAWLGVFLFLSGAVFTLKIGDQFSRGAILLFASEGFVLLIALRVIGRRFVRRGLDGQRFIGRNAVLITDETSDVNSELVPSLMRHGFRLHQQFVLPAHENDPHQQRELVAEIVAALRGSEIDEVIVSLEAKRWENLNHLLVGLRKLPLPVNLIPIGPASDILRRPAHLIGNSVFINLQREPLGAFERGIKRAVDVVGAATGLFLLMPLLLLAALLVKLESPGPILFRQRRSGFNGRQFHIYKFRTMNVLEDGPIIDQARPSDARITGIGEWLRWTSIDELPQLFNVLNGSMSLVGPRPHAVAHDNHFQKALSSYAFRHHVKPGLTGWAQVNGQRGPTPTIAELRRRVEFDLWYIDNWSLSLDFLIILRTVIEVLRARNAY